MKTTKKSSKYIKSELKFSDDEPPVNKTNIKYKKKNTAKKIDSTFTLHNLNTSLLDKNYVLPEIVRKQERDAVKTVAIDISKIDSKISTSLETLGISTAFKQSMETIYWGDYYKIQLYVNDGGKRYELSTGVKIKCTWCRNYPPEGSLMLAVPYKFISSYTHEHVYSPECINIFKKINVEENADINPDKNKRIDIKNIPKTNYYKRNLTAKERDERINVNDTDAPELVIQDYFETTKPVCSFSCMVSKCNELAEKDFRFRNGKMLISHLYYLIYGELPGKIVPAPSCDILQEYGGDFSLSEYRKNFKFITINETNQYYIKTRNILNDSVALYSLINE
jgi:hypothetical protein